MKVLLVAADTTFRDTACRQCGRKIAVGQWVANHRIRDAGTPFDGREFTVHVSCLRVLCAEAPPEPTPYDEIRAKLAAGVLA